MTDTSIKPGLYRHYRGPVYWVRGEAINTTNDAHDERMVVYVKAEDKDNPDVVPFARRKTEFLEVIPWPDGFPRPRWTHEDTFRPKAQPKHQWVGSLVHTLNAADHCIAQHRQGEGRGILTFPGAWRVLELYLEDVLKPQWFDPIGLGNVYLRPDSDVSLLPLYQGDREAMRAEVQHRLGDVLFILAGSPDRADLDALSAFIDKIKPLAESESRQGLINRRRHGRCY